MKILDVLPKEAILADLTAVDKKGVLEELVVPVARISGVNHEDLVKVLMEREQLGSTGIGDGIGIHHGKVKDLNSLFLGFGLGYHIEEIVRLMEVDHQVIVVEPSKEMAFCASFMASVSAWMCSAEAWPIAGRSRSSSSRSVWHSTGPWVQVGHLCTVQPR